MINLKLTKINSQETPEEEQKTIKQNKKNQIEVNKEFEEIQLEANEMSQKLNDLQQQFNLKSIKLPDEEFGRTFVLNMLEAKLFEDQHLCSVSKLNASPCDNEMWSQSSRLLDERFEFDFKVILNSVNDQNSPVSQNEHFVYAKSPLGWFFGVQDNLYLFQTNNYLNDPRKMISNFY
jgi:hypothetical protein